MTRIHDESLLESIWTNKVLLEKSVLAKYFRPKTNVEFTSKSKQLHKKAVYSEIDGIPFLQYLHDKIGITADSTPLIPFSFPTSSVAGSTKDYYPRGKFDPKGLGSPIIWQKKHEMLADILKRGDGIFVVNPESNTRVLAKRVQEEKEKYKKPVQRTLEYVPKHTTYDVWIFTPTGELISHKQRHLTGKYGETIPKEERSNLYVSYVDRTDAKVFIIPNTAFRPQTIKLPGEVNLGFTDTKDREGIVSDITEIEDVANDILKTYGAKIQSNISNAIEPLGANIRTMLTSEGISDELIISLVKDLRLFMKLKNNLSISNILPQIRKFLNSLNEEQRQKYNIIDDSDYVTFKTTDDLRRFCRDLVLSYLKNFTTIEFEKKYGKFVGSVF